MRPERRCAGYVVAVNSWPHLRRTAVQLPCMRSLLKRRFQRFMRMRLLNNPVSCSVTASYVMAHVCCTSCLQGSGAMAAGGAAASLLLRACRGGQLLGQPIHKMIEEVDRRR